MPDRANNQARYRTQRSSSRKASPKQADALARGRALRAHNLRVEKRSQNGGGGSIGSKQRAASRARAMKVSKRRTGAACGRRSATTKGRCVLGGSNLKNTCAVSIGKSGRRSCRSIAKKPGKRGRSRKVSPKRSPIKRSAVKKSPRRTAINKRNSSKTRGQTRVTGGLSRINLWGGQRYQYW
jgi:hypothetical protein